eukprot:scaffold24369_cov216-Skeletonema_marinoi.AAC.27
MSTFLDGCWNAVTAPTNTAATTTSLEIIADDVTCTHGATISDLSEEELFYLRSRGLDRTTARNLLMYAFVEEIGSSVDERIAGGFEDENGLRSRVTCFDIFLPILRYYLFYEL